MTEPTIPGFEPGYWDDTRRLARENLLVFYNYMTVAPGTIQLTAFAPELPQPLGAVWFRFEDDDTVGILNTFVWEPVRRCGVRRRMHRQMLALWPGIRRIRTGLSTLDGRAWMKAMGYRKTATGWELRIPKKKAAK
jgi:hypothetical protein